MTWIFNQCTGKGFVLLALSFGETTGKWTQPPSWKHHRQRLVSTAAENYGLEMGRESLPKGHVHAHIHTHMTLRASPFSFLPFFLYYIPICQSFSGSLMTMRGTQFWGSSHPWRCRLKALWRIGLRTSFPHPHQWEAHSTCARTKHNSPWSSGTAWFPESLSATAQVSTNNSLSMSNSVSGFFLLKVSKLNRIELFILIMKLIIRIIINN